jgi:hypothetical protein
LNLGDLVLRSTLGVSDDQRSQAFLKKRNFDRKIAPFTTILGVKLLGDGVVGRQKLDTHVAPILVGFIYPFSRNLNAYIYIDTMIFTSPRKVLLLSWFSEFWIITDFFFLIFNTYGLLLNHIKPI